MEVGNQLPILLISFIPSIYSLRAGWESVTNPLDKLFFRCFPDPGRWESVTNPLDKLCRGKPLHRIQLGISYQSS